jgi:hypothetical protein
MSCGCQNAKSDDFCPDEPVTSPEEEALAGGELTGQSLHRRSLLKAAAVGGTVAAFAVHHGITPAEADDLSTFQCTANDVRIVGPGIVLNEPCGCSGSFAAQVSFTVENNAASDRGCITLHLVPVTLPNGSVFDPGDVSLGGSIPGKTTQTMTGTIQNYPCGAGLICFGSPSADGRRRCDAGTCATVSWTVPGQDTCPPDRQISSKCRHQQICIQGRGAASIACVDCDVDCGGAGSVTVSTTAGVAPYTYALSDGQTFGPVNDLSHTFEVTGLTSSTNVSGSVTDGGGCTTSTLAVTLTVNAITPVISISGDENCDGLLTFTGSAEGFEDCASTDWTIDGAAAADTETDALIVRLNSDGSLSYRNLDGACHTIGATVTCGGCSGTASATATQCVTTTVAC